MLKRNPIYKGDGLDEKLGKYRSILSIYFNSENVLRSEPITIRGLGENGKTCNMTIYISADRGFGKSTWEK